MRGIKLRSAVCMRLPDVQKVNLLDCVVDVSTLLSSRKSGNGSRHVVSHPWLDACHADRYPLSLVFPVLVGRGVRLGAGGQVGAANARRAQPWECMSDQQEGG